MLENAPLWYCHGAFFVKDLPFIQIITIFAIECSISHPKWMNNSKTNDHGTGKKISDRHTDVQRDSGT